jgi:hypothetical protein
MADTQERAAERAAQPSGHGPLSARASGPARRDRGPGAAAGRPGRRIWPLRADDGDRHGRRRPSSRSWSTAWARSASTSRATSSVRAMGVRLRLAAALGLGPPALGRRGASAGAAADGVHHAPLTRDGAVDLGAQAGALDAFGLAGGALDAEIMAEDLEASRAERAEAANAGEVVVKEPTDLGPDMPKEPAGQSKPTVGGRGK